MQVTRRQPTDGSYCAERPFAAPTSVSAIQYLASHITRGRTLHRTLSQKAEVESMRDARVRVLGVLGIKRDDTGRRRAERAVSRGSFAIEPAAPRSGDATAVEQTEVGAARASRR